jgi:hypothetical protein
MSKSLRLAFAALAATALTVLSPTLSHGQQGATQTGATAGATTAVVAPVNTAAEQAIKQMIAKLRSVLAAQEMVYNEHGTYTTSMTTLSKYDPSLSMRATAGRRDSVSVQVIFAGGRGWTGIASHWGLRGKSCVVYVGIADELPKLPITRADRRTPTEESVPICDAAPAAAAGAPAPAAPAPQPAAHPAAQPTDKQTGAPLH